MAIRIHEHARERMKERGTTEDEISSTIKEGERFPAKYGRIGFRRNFPFAGLWKGKRYQTKQVEVYAIKERNDFIVVTVLVKYY